MQTQTGNKNMAAKMALAFKVGDIVSHVCNGAAKFYGEVVDIPEKTGKIMVSWSGQQPTQHCPDELVLIPEKLAGRSIFASSRRGKTAAAPVDGAMSENVAGAMFGLPKGKSTQVVETLQAAASGEINASMMYSKAAVFFNSIGLPGLAEWANGEAEEEFSHMMKVETAMRYLGVPGSGLFADASGYGELPHQGEWADAMDVFDDILAAEKHVLQLYANMVEAAKSAGDNYVETFANEMLTDQTAALDKAVNLHKKVSSVIEGDGTGLAIIDTMVGGGRPFSDGDVEDEEDDDDEGKTASSPRTARRISAKTNIPGLNYPRSASVDIMGLLKKNVREATYEREKVQVSRRSRTAMYWFEKGRVYKLTRKENPDSPVCPRCKGVMSKKSFKKSVKILQCDECCFMIPTNEVVDGSAKVTITVEQE